MMLDPTTLLTELVSQYSPSNHETPAVDYLVGAMKSAGFEAYIDPAGNAVGHMGDGDIEVLMLGHIDTVPGEIEVRTEGDLLYGRGSVDAKGPLATFTAAASIGALPGLKLTVIGALGEEIHSPGANWLRENYPRPDYLIIGEPSRWDRVTMGYKGSIWSKIDVAVPMTHTASGVTSACEHAVETWQTIQNWAADQNEGKKGEFNCIRPTLRGMDSDTDGLTDRASLRVGFRLPPGVTIEGLQASIAELLPDEIASIEWAASGEVAYRGEKNNQLVKSFLSAIRGEGGRPGFVVKTGTSDMNTVAPTWQCPTLAYGPGDSALDHTPNEHISLTEYQTAVRVLRAALEKISEKESTNSTNGH